MLCAAAARGTAMARHRSPAPIEDVAAANPKTFFQIYWLGDRDAIAERAERARNAGAVGLIVTTDWSFARQGLGQPEDPRSDGPPHGAADGAGRTGPAEVARHLRKDVAPPGFTGTQSGVKGEEGPAFFDAYGAWMVRRRPRGRTSLGCANCGRPIHAEGRHARRRRETCLCKPVFRRSRSRTMAAIIWIPRPPVPGATGGRRGGRRSDRGAARRRNSAGSDVVKALALGRGR